MTFALDMQREVSLKEAWRGTEGRREGGKGREGNGRKEGREEKGEECTEGRD